MASRKLRTLGLQLLSRSKDSLGHFQEHLGAEGQGGDRISCRKWGIKSLHEDSLSNESLGHWRQTAKEVVRFPPTLAKNAAMLATQASKNIHVAH